MPDIGINKQRLNDCPNSPNCVCSNHTDDQHGIDTILFSGNQDEAKTQLLSIINTMKRTKIITSNDDYIHAEFTSTLMSFVDDVEFYFPEMADNSTTIQVRSASRVGRSDFGVNRKRVEAFRVLLK